MKLADLFIKLGLKKDGFDKGIKDAKNKTNAFGSTIKKIGGLITGVFAVQKILSFGKELLILGGTADGVRAAFERIGGGKYLDDLKEATRGTVSELELMKRSVMASNFQIPIENLADLFKFATKRAQDTGESVDYLVNSIVTGIGRKSPLILDNLGISAVQLREKLKGVGLETASTADIAAAVGRIAADEMKKSGDIIETNAIKTQSLAAKWENVKQKIAESKTALDLFAGGIDTLDKALTVLESEHLSFWEKINIFESQDKTFNKAQQRLAEYEALTKKSNAELEKLLKTETDRHKILIQNSDDFDVYLKSARALTTLRESIEKIRESRVSGVMGPDVFDVGGGDFEMPKFEEHIKTIGELKAETDALKNSLDDYGVTQKQEIQNTLKQIEANEKLIKSLTTLNVAREDVSMSQMSGITPDFASIFSSPELDTSVLSSMDSFREMIKERYDKMINEASEFGEMMQDALRSGVTNAVVGLSEALGTAFGSGDWGGFGEAVLQVIGGFMQQLGALMISYAIYMGLFAAAATNPLSWPIALAAGIAMVAAGAAISSFASKGLGGGASAASASGYSPGGSSASTAISGNVNFVLEGDKLVGAINNNSSKRRLTR